MSLVDSNLPHYGDVPEIDKFLETAEPKYITGAIRKNLLYIHDQRIHAIIDFCQHLRANSMEWKHKEGLRLDPEIEWCDEVFDAISRGFKTDKNYRRPHKIADGPFFATLYRDRWQTFYNKGIQVLSRRYRKSYEKINALNKLLKEVSSGFPYQVDYNQVDELVSHVHKNEPLLKVLFGYLQGIVKPPIKGKHTTAKEKEKQFAYRSKKVNRILKTPKTANRTKN